MIRVVYGSSKSGTALIPIFSTINMALNISTRSGNSVITMGDGSSAISRTNPKLKDFTDGVYLDPFLYNYSSAFTGNISIKYLKGLKDVYSIQLGNLSKTSNNIEKYNIVDFELFLKHFSNLYSLYIQENSTNSVWRSIIKGDLSLIPDSVEKILIGDLAIVNAQTDFFLNISNFRNSSKLKYFKHFNSNTDQITKLKVIGDLFYLPSGCKLFSINEVNGMFIGNAITYTSGKVWSSVFDTLCIPPLSYFENDNILIDLANSVITAEGGKLIKLSGYRTPSSDSAVAYLQSIGFTVSSLPYETAFIDTTPGLVLKMPFQNDFKSYGNSIVRVAAANVNGLPSFVSDGIGGYAVTFTGSKSIKTVANLPINTTDKITVAFWYKSSGASTQFIMELNTAWDIGSTFLVLDGNGANLSIGDHNTSSVLASNTRPSTGVWTHIVAVIDRSVSKNIKIYYDKVLVKTVSDSNVGNFGSFILYIGARSGSSGYCTGQLKELNIYNYALSAAEIAAL